MKRRDTALSFQPTEAEGVKDKAHSGFLTRGVASAGRGGHFCTTFTPVAQWKSATVVSGRSPVRIGSGVLFYFIWASKRANAWKPATDARIRGIDCTVEGSLIISFYGLFVKEPVMNTLCLSKKIQVLNALVEGCSIRSVERMTGIHRDTIMRLGVEVGSKSVQLLDQKLIDLQVNEIEVDEIWCFVQKKKKHITASDNRREVGDQFIFVAMDADTKLIPSYLVGKRNSENALQLMCDLQFRVNNRFQLTTDGFRPYLDAVDKTFGRHIDYSQLVKIYSGDEPTRERYSPSDIKGVYPTPIMGNPNLSRVSTSYIERQNLTMRMQIRRLTRLTNAFSKKLGNLKAAVALHFAHYNFMRVHSSLRVTPAMEAGLTYHIWSWEELLAAN